MKTINYTEIKEISGKMYHVAHIEINRPKQLNALNGQTINDLSNKLNEIRNNSDIRSVIITATGEKAFVAGADIKEFQNFNKKEALELSKVGKSQLFKKIKHFPKPIISGIRGFALGGGLELALATHIRIAGPSAKLGLPECSLGLIPGYSGTQELPRIIGVNRAMELILTAQPVEAEEAYRIGLVNQLTQTDEEIFPECLKMAAKFNRSSPEALASAIKSINSCYLESGETVESEEFSKLFETNNFKEGVLAFLEKRKPKFNK